MKAAVNCRYGPPVDVVQILDVEKPVPKDHEVLIKVHAASVNPIDALGNGPPYLIRPMIGLRKPRDTRVGYDAAGHVEAVGRGVTQLKPGDDVFGSCRGSCAEYACAPESALVTKPANVSFEQAASAPVAALTALQGLRDKGKIRPGQKVLINGAAGGVGTFAVQIAKSFGAEVTGVCSTRNLDMVRSIGADRVIDYTREDFTTSGQRYDLLYDLVGDHSLSACRHVLTPTGIHVVAGAIAAPAGRWFRPLDSLLKAFLASLFMSGKLVVYIANSNKEDLSTIRDLIASGKVTPVIDRCYGLNEVAQALQYLQAKHARGKVVVTVTDATAADASAARRA
jgi:NADPH:quinone reductase-like Zn-dependent oxidoreductase